MVVQSFFEKIDTLSNKELLLPFTVQFLGEEGLDFGALTSSLYQEFFSQIFKEDCRLFEKSERGSTYIPRKGADLKKLELFGKILAKLIYDERVVEVPLATSVFKYLQVQKKYMIILTK